MSPIRIATRGSALALWQARHVAGKIREMAQRECELIQIRTKGDHIQNHPLHQIGGQGLFTRELEAALSSGEADIAVHSCKDLPARIPEEFALLAFMEREDPRDCVISGTGLPLAELPNGARIGSGSLRRGAQIRREFGDRFVVAPLRGNVDSRIKKLQSGEFDAVLLAGAGVKRLGHGEKITAWLPVDPFIPSVGQGILAIETLGNRVEELQFLKFLDHYHSRQAVECERALLGILNGGCQVPIAAHAFHRVGGKMGFVAGIYGRRPEEFLLERVESFDPGENLQVGKKTADRLLSRGGEKLIAGWRKRVEEDR